MDKKQALRETVELWTKMADEIHKEYIADKWDIPGPWDVYAHNCPCCEYVRSLRGYFAPQLCYKCPMYEQWRFYADENVGKFCCVQPRSPYQQWSNCVESGKVGILWYDLEFFCLLVAELACEALNECPI